LFTIDSGPFQKVFVANNKKSDPAFKPSKKTEEDTSDEASSLSSEESDEMSVLDSEDDGNPKNEEDLIKQVLNSVREVQLKSSKSNVEYNL